MKIEGQFVAISVVRQRHSLVSRSFESGHLCKSDTHLNKVENGPQLIEQLAQDSEGLQKLLQGYIIAIFRLLSQSSKDLCQLSPVNAAAGGEAVVVVLQSRQRPALLHWFGGLNVLKRWRFSDISRAMQENEQGQLFISVRESKGLQQQGIGAFCVLQLDQQQIQTRVANRTTPPEQGFEAWDEGYTFDVTQIENSQIFISVYTAEQIQDTSFQNFGDPESGIYKVGYLLVPLLALSHKKPIDQWFRLRSPECDPDVGSPRLFSPGEIHLKLHFTTTSKRVGPDDFQLLKVVGRGAFGKVMLAKKKDSQRLYAMKVVSKNYIVNNNVVMHVLSEKNILKKMSNPFVVSLKYAFQTEDKLVLVMDYVCGGELFFHLCESKRFTEDRARFYAAEIVLALEYVHSLNIIYRDLKPENLLLDMNGHVCLTDFGMCKENLGWGNQTHTFCGSPEYLAPEILLGKGYTFAVDWWAFGTLLYEMLCGMPPYYCEDTREMNQRIVFEKLTFPSYFTTESRSILTGLLERDPAKRLGCTRQTSGGSDIRAHPFFKQIDWEKLTKKVLQPPFRPNLKSEMDVRFFDPDSTQQPAAYSFGRSGLTSQQQEAFAGFSYTAPDVLEASRRLRNTAPKTNEFLRSSYTRENPSRPESIIMEDYAPRPPEDGGVFRMSIIGDSNDTDESNDGEDPLMQMSD
ncbi:hypothetical protein PROFUN_06701 [Planoprotostelium fungivorum]|uniref:non-specific serine/threonine protein kinase n=1 Tax=Planoprotostelium fungivorum TaxID=1890364 RepID=A0A2P6NG52_9EUKA|nr:hypothetical protein PROFUN_06701 [Planoprotostelium fungivorum]